MEVSAGGSMHLIGTRGANEVSLTSEGLTSSVPLDGDVTLRGGTFAQTYSVDDRAPGPVFIHGGRVVIDHATVFSVNRSEAPAGDIALSAGETISIGHGGLTSEACGYADTGCGSGSGASLSLSAPIISLEPLSVINATTFGPGAGGGIRLEAPDSISILGLDPEQEGEERGFVETATFGAGAGGDIRVRTGSLSIGLAGGIDTISCGDVCFSEVPDPPVVELYGNGGSIFVDADDVHVTEQGFIDTASFSDGRSGDISINATHSLILTGLDEPLVTREDQLDNTSISPLVTDEGDGGTLSIVTPLLRIENGATVSALTVGAGDAGNAGSVQVHADVVELLDDGRIVNTSFGDGGAGTTTIEAAQSILIEGDGGVTGQSSGLYAETYFTGLGGSIIIRTPQLVLDRAGAISVSTYGDADAGSMRVEAGDILIDGSSQIFASNYSGTQDSGGIPLAGDVGEITLIAHNSLTLTGSDAEFSSSVLLQNFGTGGGGLLTVETPRLVIESMSVLSAETAFSGSGGSIVVNVGRLDLPGGVITAEAGGTGNAGRITIAATEALRMSDGGLILTATSQSDGGDIDLTVGRLLFLDRSQIATSVAGGSGNGGNIRIDPQFVVLNRSGIVANAFGGNGGNIDIVANFFVPSIDSTVQASSALGIDGVVSITSPEVDVGEALGQLSTAYIDASRSLRSACATGIGNSFVALGRGGFPASASGSLYAPLAGMLEPPSVTVSLAPQAWLAPAVDRAPPACTIFVN